MVLGPSPHLSHLGNANKRLGLGIVEVGVGYEGPDFSGGVRAHALGGFGGGTCMQSVLMGGRGGGMLSGRLRERRINLLNFSLANREVWVRGPRTGDAFFVIRVWLVVEAVIVEVGEGCGRALKEAE